MADKKISALTSLAQGDVAASTDVLPIVDTSATETKKVTAAALVGAGLAAGVTSVDINSGSIDGTTIGANSAAAGTFTNLTASGTVSFNGATVSNGGSVTTVDINGGTIDGATIATSDITVGSGKTLNVSAGTLTLADNQISGDKVEGGTINAITINTLTSTAVNATTVDATNVEVTNLKAKDGTAAATIADSTGVVSLSANPTLSGGTANGVLYLNGSKVATSGSGFAFDGTNLTLPAEGYRPSATSFLRLSGGDGAGSGANLLVFGQSHATAPGRVNITATGTGYLQLATFGGAATLDSSGNLGIGTSSPGAKLEAASTTDGDTVRVSFPSAATGTTGGGVSFRSYTNSATLVEQARVQAICTDGSASYGGALRFMTANAGSIGTRMTLDSSGNLGLGASPAASNFSGAYTSLLVKGNAINKVGTLIAQSFGTTNATNIEMFAADGTNEAGLLVKSASTAMTFYTGSAPDKRMTLDASGNLGLGVTPSATNGTYFRAYEVGKAGCTLTGATVSLTGNSRLYLSNNAYGTYSGSVAWVYGNNDSAAQYAMESGTHKWFSAASGTAGNTISFTQAMTLDADGDLGIGTTNPTQRLHIVSSGQPTILIADDAGRQVSIKSPDSSGNPGFVGTTTNHNLLLQAGTSGAGANVMLFNTAGSERARITAGGYSKFSNDGTYNNATSSRHEFNQSVDETGLLIAPTNATYTSAAVFIGASRAANSAYFMLRAQANSVDQFYVLGNGTVYAQNTTIQSLSDGRLKENVRNATEGLDVVNALRPVRYDWKAGYGNDRKDQLGFIAQEVEAVFPDAVSEWSKAEGDDEPYKTVGPGALIPVLVKAIQELTARVAALENK